MAISPLGNVSSMKLITVRRCTPMTVTQVDSFALVAAVSESISSLSHPFYSSNPSTREGDSSQLPLKGSIAKP